MGLIAWIKSLREQDEEITIPQPFQGVCPKCGSKNIGYSSLIYNYTQVIMGTENPKYVEISRCNDCHYMEEKYE